MKEIAIMPAGATAPATISGGDICAVICTHDRTNLLRRALQSLLDQTVAPGGIMVVDNAPPNSATKELIAKEFPSVRYVLEPIPGLNFARNRALKESDHRILAFIDDDALAAPEWLAALVRAFQRDPTATLCTGRVKPLRLDTAAQKLFEAQGGFDRGERHIKMPDDARRIRIHGLRAPLIAWSVAIGVGCNMAVLREPIASLGGFDCALDLGAALPGGGDVDMIWRVLARGLSVVYEPRALVLHEHRAELPDVYSQILGHRRAEIAFLTKSLGAARGSQRVTIGMFLLWRISKPALRLIRRLLLRTDPLPAPLLVRLWLASLQGLVSYRAALRTARNRIAAASDAYDAGVPSRSDCSSADFSSAPTRSTE